MTPQETNVLLTEAALLDNFIVPDKAGAMLQVWHQALRGVDFACGRQVLQTFYANREPGGASITPGHIRKTTAREIERAAVKRAALERGPDVNYQRQVNGWRARNPGEWDRLVRAGVHEQWEAWQARGETDRNCTCGCGQTPA